MYLEYKEQTPPRGQKRRMADECRAHKAQHGLHHVYGDGSSLGAIAPIPLPLK